MLGAGKGPGFTLGPFMRSAPAQGAILARGRKGAGFYLGADAGAGFYLGADRGRVLPRGRGRVLPRGRHRAGFYPGAGAGAGPVFTQGPGPGRGRVLPMGAGAGAGAVTGFYSHPKILPS